MDAGSTGWVQPQQHLGSRYEALYWASCTAVCRTMLDRRRATRQTWSRAMWARMATPSSEPAGTRGGSFALARNAAWYTRRSSLLRLRRSSCRVSALRSAACSCVRTGAPFAPVVCAGYVRRVRAGGGQRARRCDRGGPTRVAGSHSDGAGDRLPTVALSAPRSDTENILVSGADPRPGDKSRRTDTIMIVAVDYQKDVPGGRPQVGVISVPRTCGSIFRCGNGRINQADYIGEGVRRTAGVCASSARSSITHWASVRPTMCASGRRGWWSW